MIISEVPVQLRELHHLSWWWLRFRFLAADRRTAGAKLNFLYFSYEPDFDYLLLSMKSLRHGVNRELIGQVFLVVDQKAPFSARQIAAFQDIFPTLHVLPIFNFEWGSARSTFEELGMFKTVCASLPSPFDLLVKVDSDVLFLRNDKWRKLLCSRAAAIGDGHFLQHRCAQGGLYMLRRHLIQNVFWDTSLADLESVVKKIDSHGEDRAISYMLRRSGNAFFFTRMMLFPDEYRGISRLGSWVRREFLALHCHKDKTSMAALIRKFDIAI